MSRTDFHAIIKEAIENSIKNRSRVDEMFGRSKTPKQPERLSADDWSTKARHHRNLTVKHTELADDFDRMGNRVAGDYHTKAADAHSKAAKALYHHGSDIEGYKKAAKVADEASREANFYVK